MLAFMQAGVIKEHKQIQKKNNADENGQRYFFGNESRQISEIEI